MNPSNLRDLVEFMAKSLVDEPEQVEVNEVKGEQTTVVELMDSLKVLTTENPQLVTGFVELLEELKKVGG